jgi:nucleoside 2-deoxyribosyltransferase
MTFTKRTTIVIQPERFVVYFARAMEGLSDAQIRSQSDDVQEELRQAGMQMIDPYVYESAGSSGLSPSEIVENDIALLVRADAMLMDMTVSNRNYVGCMCEIVYAHLAKVPTIVYVGNSGNGDRMWLRYHATSICTTRDEALLELHRLRRLSAGSI